MVFLQSINDGGQCSRPKVVCATMAELGPVSLVDLMKQRLGARSHIAWRRASSTAIRLRMRPGAKPRAGGKVREQVIQAVNKYIDAVRHNDPSAAPLHPDVVGEFPTNTYEGAVSFRRALEPFARIVKSIDVLRLVVDGEHCVALLDIDTVYGPIPFAEHIHVVNGEIVRVRGYYDPRPMLNATSGAIK